MRVQILTEEGTNTVGIGVGEILDLDLEADQDHQEETTDQKSHAKLTI